MHNFNPRQKATANSLYTLSRSSGQDFQQNISSQKYESKQLAVRLPPQFLQRMQSTQILPNRSLLTPPFVVFAPRCGAFFYAPSRQSPVWDCSATLTPRSIHLIILMHSVRFGSGTLRISFIKLSALPIVVAVIVFTSMPCVVETIISPIRAFVNIFFARLRLFVDIHTFLCYYELERRWFSERTN